MSEINSIGIRGLRSFGYETQSIPFRKINIYVGKNSCGKSSYLRTFPLLRQSVESDTRFPILWYAGHGSYVDFGNFESALHDTGESIHFDFNLTLSPLVSSIRRHAEVFEDYYTTSLPNQLEAAFDVNISVSLKNKEKTLGISIKFEIENSHVELNYSGEDVSSLIATNKKYDIVEQFSTPLQISKGSLIPRDVLRRRQLIIKGSSIRRVSSAHPMRQEALISLSKYLQQFHHKSKQLKNIQHSLEYLALTQKNRLYKNIKSIFSSDKYFIRKLDEHKNEILDVVFTYLFAKNIYMFWESADEAFKKFYGGVRYLGPLRASAERFYRHQDLQIGEIDHTGANLPMVINSLSDVQKEELTIWIKENFGFDLLLETAGLHYALLIREEHDLQYHNVSDMGFGYSQILPVIVSIWLELTSESTEPSGLPSWMRAKASRSIVIEQPELHLHPALQYKFGLAIAKVISLVKERDYNFIIETHSKHLIDAIGQSIADSIIDQDYVNITLFEKGTSGVTDVTLSGFDNEGYLVNWPAGFLSA
ncbi:hypothetical protein B1F73_22745 [Pseudomonas syringae]|uniref:AAA family ATPase n=1 Tax=Pseudomonas TaxID=286 RepID=UPI000886E850|nr:MULTISPECIES: AAA family ATPase [Pseudomonas]NAP04930.1 AAA family ATPase [Pseudomonas syringae]NAP25548.1 AAA family ATPase [Pseudomonas syringae]NAP52587.1 AAA family ATPase [Pseudomonas syringae]NAP86465.1 AAA family ATPase [Pseudomonas syringae]RMS28063.1 hypothetical protein ALP69_02788 [Pseudomonas syringae pv. aceris]